MIVKINQQVKLETCPNVSEKFYIYKGEGITLEYLGLDGKMYKTMWDTGGCGHYFDTYEEAKAHAEGFGHDVEESDKLMWSF